MKRLTIFTCAVLILISPALQAQINVGKILKNVKKNTENKIERKIEKKLNNGVDTLLEGTEKGIKNTINGTPKKEESATSKKDAASAQKNSVIPKQDSIAKKPLLQWSKFDFVPGTEVIFEDDFANEQNGEFPSKWDLFQGTFENAVFDGFNVVYCINCNMNGGGGIVPMLKNSKSDYLPEEFTVEFDAYFDNKNEGSYMIYFLDYKNQKNLDKSYPNGDKWVRFYKNSVDAKGVDKNYYPGFKFGVNDASAKWRHFSVSFNKRALKVYIDDARALNIPNLSYNPTGISIGFHSPGGERKGFLKNIKIAKGAVPLYDKVLTDGKFVTTGIKFDVNKATIKPESMGTINYVVKMMTDNPQLNFSVEGHTDSDGDNALNQTLSEQRAKAVLDVLVSSGISSSRLTSKGWGESKPVSGNNTPEEKANNRRVEFVKF